MTANHDQLVKIIEYLAWELAKDEKDAINVAGYLYNLVQSRKALTGETPLPPPERFGLLQNEEELITY